MVVVATGSGSSLWVTILKLSPATELPVHRRKWSMSNTSSHSLAKTDICSYTDLSRRTNRMIQLYEKMCFIQIVIFLLLQKIKQKFSFFLFPLVIPECAQSIEPTSERLLINYVTILNSTKALFTHRSNKPIHIFRKQWIPYCKFEWRNGF